LRVPLVTSVANKEVNVSTTFQRSARPVPDEAPLHEPAGLLRRDSRYQAFLTLRVGYTVLPIAMGIDKYFNSMVYWPKYLADWIDNIMPGTAQQFMYFVGAVEILAGLLVLLKPRYAAYIVAAWLAGIVINLFSYGEWYDVAVRDFGLMLGALTLGRLAAYYDPPLRLRRR
jgi:uncharacterized membrane protein YphA (DoxX/SURF4 family)